MKIKQTALILLFGALIVGGCKKSDKATPISAFDKITLTDIKAQEANFKSENIDGTTAEGQVLKNGAIIFYKTNSGNYGKLRVISIAGKNAENPDLSDLITIDMITYKTGESVINKPKLTIRGTYYCDLDIGVEEGDLQTSDFQWSRQNMTYIFISPLNGATFYKYSN
ncbi:MAG: hypothetical protein WBP45_01600 [Daejeonella sp.]